MDIFLFDDPPTTLVAQSTNPNLGADPLEVLAYINPGPGTAFIVAIAKYLPAGGPDPGRMKVIRPGSSDTMAFNEWQTDSSTIFGHPNAAGAVAVGSAWHFQTPEFGTDPAELRPSSSGGGTPIFFSADGTRLEELRSESTVGESDAPQPPCPKRGTWVQWALIARIASPHRSRGRRDARGTGHHLHCAGAIPGRPSRMPRRWPHRNTAHR